MGTYNYEKPGEPLSKNQIERRRFGSIINYAHLEL
jgi:hypothetical protein